MSNPDDGQLHTLNDAVAATLRAERAVARMTTRALADQSGVPERTLIRLLGAERDINVDQILKLAEAMGKKGSYILLEAERRLADAKSTEGLGMTAADEAALDRLADSVDPKVTRATRRNRRKGDDKSP